MNTDLTLIQMYNKTKYVEPWILKEFVILRILNEKLRITCAYT